MILSDKRANNYLQSLLKISQPYQKVIEAIILFGSYARGNPSKFSDVDVLIVLKKPNKRIYSHLAGQIQFLERKFGYSIPQGNIIEYLLNYVNIATGMFKSWFICSYEDLKDLKFAKITQTNVLLGKIFAPYKEIIWNIQKDAVILFGNKDIIELIPKIPETQPQLFKSLMINELISLSSLVIAPFTKYSFLYSIEAIKWSIFKTKINFLNSLPANSLLKKYLILYNSVKKRGIMNKKLTIISPYIIYKIHREILRRRLE